MKLKGIILCTTKQQTVSHQHGCEGNSALSWHLTHINCYRHYFRRGMRKRAKQGARNLRPGGRWATASVLQRCGGSDSQSWPGSWAAGRAGPRPGQG